MFGNLLKAVVGAAVVTPLSVAADVVTLGGAMSDRDEPYTASALKDIGDNLSKAVDPND